MFLHFLLHTIILPYMQITSNIPSSQEPWILERLPINFQVICRCFRNGIHKHCNSWPWQWLPAVTAGLCAHGHDIRYTAGNQIEETEDKKCERDEKERWKIQIRNSYMPAMVINFFTNQLIHSRFGWALSIFPVKITLKKLMPIHFLHTYSYNSL